MNSEKWKLYDSTVLEYLSEAVTYYDAGYYDWAWCRTNQAFTLIRFAWINNDIEIEDADAYRNICMAFETSQMTHIMAIHLIHGKPDNDIISREQAINEMWKALYDYQDKTEKQFEEDPDLDVSDWYLHRIFVQNMSAADMNAILNLPAVKADHTCATCGRCSSSPKWMAKEGTGCPIEKSYALPNDGFCHLWEPRGKLKSQSLDYGDESAMMPAA